MTGALTFRNTNVVTLLALALTITADVLHGISVFIYLAIAFIYSVILFYGCYYIGSNFFMPVICSAKTGKNEIAISFDDGPAALTPQILAVLEQHRVQAAFFCIGKNLAGNEDIVKQIHLQQHIIGNHSFSHHFWFDIFPAKKMQADLQAMDNDLEKIIGVRPMLFRPPYGVTNPNVKKAVIHGNYLPIGWSVRSMDTVITDENKLLAKVSSKLKPGAIFLFHDTCKTTLAILPAFIKQVTDSGYRIVRLDKMLNLQPYA